MKDYYKTEDKLKICGQTETENRPAAILDLQYAKLPKK